MRTRLLPLGLMLCASQPTAAQIRDSLARPAVRLAQTTDRIRVDGQLTEPAWTTADSIAGLTQVEPNEGVAATMRTVVRVIATADAIIIGVRADDPEPSRIVSFARQRDAVLDTEDHIKIVLDTYLDGRSGYVFAINPSGSRYDALVNQGGNENSSWDAIWEAA